jgi:hypothetical protein
VAHLPDVRGIVKQQPKVSANLDHQLLFTPEIVGDDAQHLDYGIVLYMSKGCQFGVITHIVNKPVEEDVFGNGDMHSYHRVHFTKSSRNCWHIVHHITQQTGGHQTMFLKPQPSFTPGSLLVNLAQHMMTQALFSSQFRAYTKELLLCPF